MKFPQEFNGYMFKTKVSHLDEGIGCDLEWRGMASAMRHCPRHTTLRWHTCSAVTRNKDRTFCCRPSGRKWKVCNWWTKTAMCQKQYHYRHLECEITESSTKSWRTNTWNDEIPMEHPCEVRWKNFEETSTPEGHKLFFSGSEDRHEHGVGFLIHKDTVKPSWDANQSLADLLSFLWRHPLMSPSSKLMPQQLTMMMMTLKTSMFNCKKP